MAGYSTSNPPSLIKDRVGGGLAVWAYNSAGDTDDTVNGAGYFTNAGDLGMLKGDMVYMFDGTKGSVLYVSGVTAGAATTAFAAVA